VIIGTDRMKIDDVALRRKRTFFLQNNNGRLSGMVMSCFGTAF